MKIDANQFAQEFGVDQLRDAIDRVPPDNTSKKTSKARFNLIPFDSLTVAPTSAYLIKGIIPRTGLVVVWGPPKCGKSFLVFTLMLHVALSRDYRGNRVQQGNVVYLALEGQDGFGARAAAFRSKYMPDGGSIPGFYLVKEKTDLIRDHKQLIECIKSQCIDGPAAVIIDTMNRSLVGSESSDEDMANYLRATDVIREQLGSVVVVIHHCGVDSSRPRGHTSLSGAADVQICVNKDAANNIVARVERSKDTVEGAIIVSRLEQVQLGVDQDGDVVSSCAIVPVTSSIEMPPPNSRYEPATHRAFRAAFTEALDAAGQTIRIRGNGPTVRAVNVTKVRAEFYRRHATGEDDPVKRNETQRKAFRRALDKLDQQFPRCVIDDVEWIWSAK